MCRVGDGRYARRGAPEILGSAIVAMEDSSHVRANGIEAHDHAIGVRQAAPNHTFRGDRVLLARTGPENSSGNGGPLASAGRLTRLACCQFPTSKVEVAMECDPAVRMV